MTAEEFEKFIDVVYEARNALDVYHEADLWPSEKIERETGPILALLKLRDVNIDEQSVSKALWKVHVKYAKQIEWKRRVKRGAMLLGQIQPGWEARIDFNILHFGGYPGRCLLSQIYQIDDIRRILPLVFAGRGLQNVPGIRRQPGPPPPLHGAPEGYSIWEGEITTGHYLEAAKYGFSPGLGSWITNEELVLLWLELVLQRMMDQLD
jgi:hypothetical protein